MHLCECGNTIFTDRSVVCVTCRNRANAVKQRATPDRGYFEQRTTPADGGCQEWSLARTPVQEDGTGGYGSVGRGVGGYGEGLAHRLAYRALVGPIPDGVEVSHLCENPPCVNPDHLTVESHAANMRRSAHIVACAAKTHCPQGHPYDGENLIIQKKGSRACRTCARAANRLSYHKRRARLQLPGGDPPA